MGTFRLAMAQINSTVGDLEGNTAKIIDYVEQARVLRADLVAFPELAIPGYPPEDLVFKPEFVGANLRQMHKVVEACRGIAVAVGFVDHNSHIRNASALAYDGKLIDVYHKMCLPNYGVFDEERYFTPGDQCPVYLISGALVGVNICEDIWEPGGPTVAQRSAGAEIIVNISASPYYAGKLDHRAKLLATRACDNEVFIGYVNMVGGQDELVFDGASMVLGPNRDILAQGSQFQEELIVVDLKLGSTLRSRKSERILLKKAELNHSCESTTLEVSNRPSENPRPPLPHRIPVLHDGPGEIYAALVTGTRDYVHKSGFDKVLVALSGGIDSSLVATVAADALGPENVTGIWMPSRYSSKESLRDARALAENLRVEFQTLSIEDSFATLLETLATPFEGTKQDLTEENLQSRIRGVLIMALSNKLNRLVLTTGNKSELAVGYATIYGDMAGGFAVIKDVPKTIVYQLAEYRIGLSGKSGPIPRSVLAKPPSAELRPDQKDEDSLPPYAVLDPILKAYVEDDLDFAGIVAMGFEKDMVKQIITLVDQSEFKRRQSPPGIKITARNFGRDRRMPIANRFRPF